MVFEISVWYDVEIISATIRVQFTEDNVLFEKENITGYNAFECFDNEDVRYVLYRDYQDKFYIHDIALHKFPIAVISVKKDTSTSTIRNVENKNVCMICGTIGHYAQSCEKDENWAMEVRDGNWTFYYCDQCGTEFMDVDSYDEHILTHK